MSLTAQLPNHLRPRREKVFGDARGIPLDRNAKARIMTYARAWNARMRQPRQHRGPLTRAYLEVLEALLWGFHNSRDGRCFPSYERIAEKAECNRDTVYEAIKALEAAGIMSWVNRLTRVRIRVADLFGKWGSAWKLIRTSNAYSFRDPLPCQPGRPAMAFDNGNSSKSENPSGTPNPESYNSTPPTKIIVLDPSNLLDSALIRLGRTLGSLPEAKRA